MKILVTGGAGLIGSNLCKRLLDHGDQVICLDNFSTSRRENVEPLLKREGFKLVEHDVTQVYNFLEVDQIYNLACPASPVHYQKTPVETVRTCVQGAINALELAKKLNIPVLQASTSEVYGDPEVHPQPETYTGNVNQIGPRACYDEGKRCAETLFFDYHREWGVKIKVVRIFNTYGPNNAPDDGRVVSNFILQALRGESITMQGDGSKTRAFCYVDDLVEGLIKMMNSTEIGPINLGNPGEFTMQELAELIIELTGSKSKIVNEDNRPDDPKIRRPDISLAKEKLGWEPTIALREGLQKTIEYFKPLA
ncbi:NAD-dependent dehydratase [bacterium]|nr:NAD-dependent dehydratase [bacterium]